MSKDALRDAFVAGWNGGRKGPTRLADNAFDEWYQNALDTLDRSPTIIGIDLAAPGSDMHVCGIISTDGPLTFTPIKDDGWLAWDGSLDYPTDVSASTIVDVKMRGGFIDHGSRAGIWEWRFRQADANANIVAYRVIKP